MAMTFQHISRPEETKKQEVARQASRQRGAMDSLWGEEQANASASQPLTAPHFNYDFTQIPLYPEHSTLQMSRPRSVSNPLSQGDSGGKVACYGVSQGHYKTIGMFDGMIGTSSLGSCFAVIVHSGPSVFFCHVHACSEEVLNNFASLISVGSAKIVKGKAPSENTNNLIDLLVQKGATVHGGTGTGAVVYNPLTKEISTPGDIQPTNDDYLAKNGVGAKMKADEALQSM